MSPRRRSKRGGGEEHHVDERWLVSYADMVTVLMCLFIVLYAMSTVDANKFEKLRNSLATGFGAVASETVDTASGTVVPQDLVDRNLEAFAASQTQTDSAEAEKPPTDPPAAAPTDSPTDPTALEEAKKEVNLLKELEAKMRAGLAAENLGQNVDFQIDPRGLTVKLVGSQTFFEPDRPELTGRAAQVLNVIGPILAPAGMEVRVEGHAADAVTAYPSTWELSSSRAVNVLRFMVERGGVPRADIGAIAFGSARQVNDNSSAALMELNRRVDIVVLSDKPDVVRALIPEVLRSLEK